MTRRRRVAGLERRRVDERLERRTRLTARLDRAIEVALVEVAAADHRAHVPGRRIDRDERRLQRIDITDWRFLGGQRAPGRHRVRSGASIALSESATAVSAAICIGMSMVENTRSPPW